MTEQAASNLALRLGADPQTAQTVGTAVDIAVPFAVSAGVGAARLVSIRFGRIRFVEHEGAAGSRLGGHTIAKHVGKTEAELRVRLATERQHRAVSSFATLDVAERVIYQAVRANKAAIETWARAAGPNSTGKFFLAARQPVGIVLVRATNQVHAASAVRIVLKLQAYNGKHYYILTAFPQL